MGIDTEVVNLSARRIADLEYTESLPTTSSFGTVIVDDFHVLDDSMRAHVADLLKALADAEDETSKLIIVGINRAGDSLIKHAPDLTNRIDTIGPLSSLCPTVHVGVSVRHRERDDQWDLLAP